MKGSLYTVVFSRKVGLYRLDNPDTKLVHGSDDGKQTICGKIIALDGHWFIRSNDFSGEVTCKHCIGIMKKFDFVERGINS